MSSDDETPRRLPQAEELSEAPCGVDEPGFRSGHLLPEHYSLRDWGVLALGTGLFLGLLPLRTATIATLLGIPLALGLHALAFSLAGWGGLSLAWGWAFYLGMLPPLWLLGIPLCKESSRLLAKDDPGEVTYDEISTLPLVYFLAPVLSWRVLFAGFALHRVFDILKPLGLRRLEKLPGGLGIMADDVGASALACLVMHLLYYWHTLP